MKNTVLLATLLMLLNIDIGAMMIFAKYPHVFGAKTGATISEIQETKSVAIDVPVDVGDITPTLDLDVENPDAGEEENSGRAVGFDTDINVIGTKSNEITHSDGYKIASVPKIENLEPITPPVRRDVMLRDFSNFRQDERGWAYDPLGHTRQTMREYGCTVTSVANAITNYDRDYITPKILNNNLKQVGGFTDRGWLVWSQISRATDGKYSARVFNGGNPEAQIDACLAANEYPVVKIMLRGTVQHWVLVVGRKNGEYMVRDPLEGDRDERPIPLSSRAKKVHSVRCIGPN